MEPEIVMADKLIKLFLRNAFIRNGSVTLNRDENGEVTQIIFASDNNCGLADLVCPYCGKAGISNEPIYTGLAIEAGTPNKGGHEDLEINGFRCVSCEKLWLMLVSAEGWGISLGLKPPRAN